MPMDGFTLHFLARELREALVGARVDRAVQPERDEVLLTMRNHNENFNVLFSASAGCARAHITRVKKNNPLEPPMLCMLLRKHLSGARVTDVRQIDCDRILEIAFEHFDELGERTTKTLVCEFMGKHSNLIFLTADGKIIDSARHVTEQISSVRQVLPGLYYQRPPAHGKLPFLALEPAALAARLAEAPKTLHKALSECVSGLSTQTAREIAYRTLGDESASMGALAPEAVAEAVVRVMQEMLGEFSPALLYAPGEDAPIDAVPIPFKSRAHLDCRPMPSLSAALDEFYRARDLAERMQQKSAALHRVLKNNLERSEKKLAIQEEALLNCERAEDYRIRGELLMANLHLVSKGAKRVSVPNYYDEALTPMEIELDERISPAQNAQRYFKRYQKARSARKFALEQKAIAQEEIRYLASQLLALETCTEEAELAEIREELEKLGYVRANHNRRQMKKLPPSTPLRFTAPSGAEIFVGKNNRQNDELTFSAKPGYVWLHAKDMPGSHVIIARENPDEATIRYAASLAARYSSGRESGRVPIDYALKKYVKKPSGAKPGFVTYTNQKTLYAEPLREA